MPLSKFAYLRAVNGLRERYRQEWSYGFRCGTEIINEEIDHIGFDRHGGLEDVENLRVALAGLEDLDRRIISQLYVEGRTEAEAAAELGIGQPAVSKRKGTALGKLRRALKKNLEN